MSVLIDTNVFLRRVQPSHPHHPIAIEAVARLVERREATFFTLQNMAEFWVIATRPVANGGLGYTGALAMDEIARIEGVHRLLPDTAAVYDEWRRLVAMNGVMGVKAHDARLAASARTHQIGRLMTFNLADFKRFGVNLLDPFEV